MQRVTVFCGSSAGTDSVYSDVAFRLGQTLAKQNIGLVYGGARIGLMGAVADGALSEGGEVIGVLPTFLSAVEIKHPGLTELHLVSSMHDRKTKMNDLTNGVIALPGGFGTLEEFFEMLTWAQLGLHRKPVALLNVAGFYNGMIDMFQNMVDKGFLKQENQRMLLIGEDIDELITLMKTYNAPVVPKWINKNTA